MKKLKRLLLKRAATDQKIDDAWKALSKDQKEAFYKEFVKDEQIRKASRRKGAGIHGDVLTVDLPMLTVDESDMERLWIRVGPVYTEGNKVARQPGIWIEYQERSMVSPVQGPCLLSPSIWRRLNKAVEKMLGD